MRIKPVSSATETISKIRNVLELSLGIILSKKQITKALTRLRGCAGWSTPLLFANPEDRFSRVEAHLRNSGVYKCTCSVHLHRLIVLIYISLFSLLALLFHFLNNNIYIFLSLACLEEHGYSLGCICNLLANYILPSTNDVFAICHKFDPTIWGQGRTTHLMLLANMLTDHGSFHQIV